MLAIPQARIGNLIAPAQAEGAVGDDDDMVAAWRRLGGR